MIRARAPQDVAGRCMRLLSLHNFWESRASTSAPYSATPERDPSRSGGRAAELWKGRQRNARASIDEGHCAFMVLPPPPRGSLPTGTATGGEVYLTRPELNAPG